MGIATRAAHAGHRVLFDSATGWVARLAEAHNRGQLTAELTKLRRYKVLVIDEVGYIPFDQDSANLFFQLVSSRYERASLILTSNLGVRQICRCLIAVAVSWVLLAVRLWWSGCGGCWRVGSAG